MKFTMFVIGLSYILEEGAGIELTRLSVTLMVNLAGQETCKRLHYRYYGGCVSGDSQN